MNRIEGKGQANTHTPVGREAEAVDGVGMVQGVQVLPVIQVPQHGLHHEKLKLRAVLGIRIRMFLGLPDPDPSLFS